MIYGRKALNATLIMGLATLLQQIPARAQQDSSPAPSKDEPPKPAVYSPLGVFRDVAPDDAGAQSAPVGPPNPYAGTIKDVGTGLPLFGTSSTPLRWGDFSISAFDFIGVHDNFDLSSSPNALTSDLYFLRAGLMYDHYLWKDKNRIVLQYLPQLAIANGHVYANAAMNNNLSLGTKFELTPRLSLTVGDIFVQTQSNPLIPLNYLSTDANAGSFVQNNFLETNGSFIANTASGVLEYALSPRSNVTFSPQFRYSRAINNLSNYQANGQAYAGVFTFGHALTPHRTMGIVDSFQYLKESTLSTPQNATYNTIGLFYSEQLARTFWISGNLGAVNQSSSNLAVANGWGFNGGLSLIKSLTPRITLTLGYSRGMTFSNYVTLRRSDRVDASAGFRVTSRISWNNSIGYFRELGAEPRTSAKYAETDFTYRIIGSFNFFTTFAYTFQSSSTVQLLSGTRKTLAYGIRWSPSMRSPR
jgi:hypothetical protein